MRKVVEKENEALANIINSWLSFAKERRCESSCELWEMIQSSCHGMSRAEIITMFSKYLSDSSLSELIKISEDWRKEKTINIS